MEFQWTPEAVRSLMAALKMNATELGAAAGGWTTQTVINWAKGYNNPSRHAAQDLTALAKREGIELTSLKA